MINLVGIKREVGTLQTFQNVHVQFVRLLLQIAKQLQVQKFIHISVLASRMNGGKGGYHESKAIAEELITQSDLNYTILKPSVSVHQTLVVK